jgi:hypothetical protein
MKEILAEQINRRMTKKRKVATVQISPAVTATTDGAENSGGAAALSSLMRRASNPRLQKRLTWYERVDIDYCIQHLATLSFSAVPNFFTRQVQVT